MCWHRFFRLNKYQRYCCHWVQQFLEKIVRKVSEKALNEITLRFYSEFRKTESNSKWISSNEVSLTSYIINSSNVNIFNTSNLKLISPIRSKSEWINLNWISIKTLSYLINYLLLLLCQKLLYHFRCQFLFPQ